MRLETPFRLFTKAETATFGGIEDLQVRNMSRPAAGGTGQPGKNVRAKASLNKKIIDQGWFEFRRQLDCKLQWAGGMLIAVPPQNTSRICPRCSLWRAGAVRPLNEAGTRRSAPFRQCACIERRRNPLPSGGGGCQKAALVAFFCGAASLSRSKVEKLYLSSGDICLRSLKKQLIAADGDSIVLNVAGRRAGRLSCSTA